MPVNQLLWQIHRASSGIRILWYRNILYAWINLSRYPANRELALIRRGSLEGMVDRYFEINMERFRIMGREMPGFDYDREEFLLVLREVEAELLRSFNTGNTIQSVLSFFLDVPEGGDGMLMRRLDTVRRESLGLCIADVLDLLTGENIITWYRPYAVPLIRVKQIDRIPARFGDTMARHWSRLGEKDRTVFSCLGEVPEDAFRDPEPGLILKRYRTLLDIVVEKDGFADGETIRRKLVAYFNQSEAEGLK